MKLRGDNQIDKFTKIAENLVSKVVRFKGVTGIVVLGGLARGFADKYSDVDVLVFLDKRDENLRKRLRKLRSDEQKHFNVDIDLEVHFFADFSKLKWSEMSRWDFSHAKIAYDPKGKIENLFAERLQVSENFWVKRIVVYSEYLKWYCCPSIENPETVATAWIARGDLVSAHYCISYCLDLILSVLFALNKEFLPPQKWRLFYSYSLKWLPTNYATRLGEVITIQDYTERDVNRRVDTMKSMWKEILSKIELETRLTPELISKHYVEKVLHQG